MKNKRALIAFWLIILSIVLFIIADLLLLSYPALKNNNILNFALSAIPVIVLIYVIYRLIYPSTTVRIMETKLFSCFASSIIVKRESFFRGFFCHVLPQIVVTDKRIKIGFAGVVDILPMHSLYFQKSDVGELTTYSLRSVITNVNYLPNYISVSTFDGFIYKFYMSKDKFQQLQNILKQKLG